jgi:hypothetical protein
MAHTEDNRSALKYVQLKTKEVKTKEIYNMTEEMENWK